MNEPSAEAQLEAAIWTAMTEHEVTCPRPVKFIDALVIAARSYAAGDSETLTAQRRSILHRDTAPARTIWDRYLENEQKALGS